MATLHCSYGPCSSAQAITSQAEARRARLQAHGFPKILGVLTHLDHFKDTKRLRKTKKRMKAVSARKPRSPAAQRPRSSLCQAAERAAGLFPTRAPQPLD